MQELQNNDSVKLASEYFHHYILLSARPAIILDSNAGVGKLFEP